MGALLVLWVLFLGSEPMRAVVRVYCAATGVEGTVRELDSPRFADRERAHQQLVRQCDFLVALRLRGHDGRAESRRRATRISHDWFQSDGTAWPKAPVIDALNPGATCMPPDCTLVQRYLSEACDLDYGDGWVISYGRYRAATLLLVGDLRRCAVPPVVVRVMLALMWDAERRWMASRVGK